MYTRRKHSSVFTVLREFYLSRDFFTIEAGTTQLEHSKDPDQKDFQQNIISTSIGWHLHSTAMKKKKGSNASPQ